MREIVTGERLQSLAEVSVLSARKRASHRHVQRYARTMIVVSDYAKLDEDAVKRLSTAQSLFIYGDELEPFIKFVWPRLDGTHYVLLTHNSDAEIGATYLPWLETTGHKLGAWFAQNLTATHSKLRPLPIGIANSMWPHGNLRILRKAIAATTPRSKLVFLEFNTATHAERTPVARALAANFTGEASAAVRVPRPYPDYLRELARHDFCVCPRGNGIDTHRLWECLYLGVTPIVRRSAHTARWRALGLPLLLVDDWNSLTPASLRAARGQFNTRASAGYTQALRMSHYAAVVRAAVYEDAAANGA